MFKITTGWTIFSELKKKKNYHKAQKHDQNYLKLNHTEFLQRLKSQRIAIVRLNQVIRINLMRASLLATLLLTNE